MDPPKTERKVCETIKTTKWEKHYSPPEVGSDFQFSHQSFNFLNQPPKVLISSNLGTFSQNAFNSDFYFPKCPQQ
jgi:hypothetical protein